MKYCIYSRSFFENDYLSYFIKHYINLGFDKIIILHSGGSKYNLSNVYSNIVDIHYVKNSGNKLLFEYDYLVKVGDFDWVLSIDIDELLLLNKKYKNINEYVEEKLLLDNNINSFYFRWGMIEKYDIENNYNFSHILKKYKIFSNLHIKTMFKKENLKRNISENPHIVNLTNLTIYFENKIIKDNNIIIHSIDKNSYKEHILIHLHTRNLDNLVLKSFLTQLDRKKMKYVNEFVEFINNLDDKKISISNDVILNNFLKYVGLKAILPFEHSKGKLIMFEYDEYDILKYNYEIMNSSENIDMLECCLKEHNIDLEKYNYLRCYLSDKFINEKKFIHSDVL